jgi:hypothetical protein
MPTDAADLHPAAIADSVSRLQDIADLLQFEMPVAEETEHRMALELARLRALEEVSVVATLATLAARARPPEIAA